MRSASNSSWAPSPIWIWLGAAVVSVIDRDPNAAVSDSSVSVLVVPLKAGL